MPNVDAPRGFSPVRHVYGAPYNGACNVYATAAGDATAIFLGDPVTLSGTSQTIDGVVYSDVDQAATGDIVAGVVVGVKPVHHQSAIYREASTVRLLYVCDDPTVLFEIQEVSGGTPLTANDQGLNANFVVGSGNTANGQSGVELNNSGEASTATLDLKIVQLSPKDDNAIGEHAKWLVMLNKHRFANQVAGA